MISDVRLLYQGKLSMHVNRLHAYVYEVRLANEISQSERWTLVDFSPEIVKGMCFVALLSNENNSWHDSSTQILSTTLAIRTLRPLLLLNIRQEKCQNEWNTYRPKKRSALQGHSSRHVHS